MGVAGKMWTLFTVSLFAFAARTGESCSPSVSSPSTSSVAASLFPFPFKTQCPDECSKKMKDLTMGVQVAMDIGMAGCAALCMTLEQTWDDQIKKVIDDAKAQIGLPLGRMGKQYLMLTATTKEQPEMDDSGVLEPAISDITVVDTRDEEPMENTDAKIGDVAMINDK